MHPHEQAAVANIEQYLVPRLRSPAAIGLHRAVCREIAAIDEQVNPLIRELLGDDRIRKVEYIFNFFRIEISLAVGYAYNEKEVKDIHQRAGKAIINWQRKSSTLMGVYMKTKGGHPSTELFDQFHIGIKGFSKK